MSGLSLETIPEQIGHEAKRLILDSLGCLIAGVDCEIGTIARNMAAWFGGHSRATIAGARGRGSVLGAIYANARTANALDFDETFPVGAHFGSAGVVVALALAEELGLSGPQVLLATIAGYEAAGRVASYIGPVVHIDNARVVGFPDVWGVAAPVVIAAAAATAKAHQYEPALFEQAIGLAGSNAPLPVGAQWSSAIDLPNCKYCDAGWCAVTGTVAALSAQEGSRGFTELLDSDRGLARMYGVANADSSLITADLGRRFMLEDITYKPWPSCRFTHYALTALADLMRELRPLAVNSIREVVVETGPLAASARFTNPEPVTFASQQFSYPHMIAMMLLEVPPGPAWFDPKYATDLTVLAIKAKTRIVQHPRGGQFAETFVRNQIRTMPGGITIVTADRIYRAESDYARGDPWSPTYRFGDVDILDKFAALVPGEDGAELAEAIMNLEHEVSVSRITAALGRASARTIRQCA
ncbi:MmgE/PrpD family protein [Bradyrhizobium sp. 142]|uniref:MmgE/PrpD family protein n=1 Tax=Bradyrhizobium sp. 142 TaxID=2782618 RepID=UPI001FFB31B1|nr:MmgE/PrpD family protein [Bradyrhizobium sp. 142]MCK1732321.1 MmgE/PrpD family protein [Bradyrhizobium sp. 142]